LQVPPPTRRIPTPPGHTRDDQGRLVWPHRPDSVWRQAQQEKALTPAFKLEKVDHDPFEVAPPLKVGDRTVPAVRVDRNAQPLKDRATKDQEFRERLNEVLEKAKAVALMHKASMTPEDLNASQYLEAQTLTGGGSVDEKLQRLMGAKNGPVG
jgi:hypothetical protein